MLRSIWVWTAISVLIVAWLPLLAAVRLFDRDPALYRTGYLFRRLGWIMTRVNPFWRIDLSGHHAVENPRRPFVVVGNHQSLADVPVVSCLPWEMKWVGKSELFRIPLVGWMMRLAGDIELDRDDPKSGVRALLAARDYLRNHCSVIFFPEGTRSPDGRVLPFNEGAFLLAIKEQVPVLPIVVDGTRDALPKNSWQFGNASKIRIRVLPAAETEGLTRSNAAALCARVRTQMTAQLAVWRNAPLEAVDAAYGEASAERSA